jgi:hypothetical protein
MNLLHTLLGFPELTDIDIQLGAAIDDEPAPELKALYLQLMVGFQLISERNNYPGYALIGNEGVEDGELRLVLEREHAAISAAKRSHGYWRTAVLAAQQKARRYAVILKGRLKWIEAIDPILFSAMENSGKPLCNRDCGHLLVHFNMEQEVKRPLSKVQTAQDWPA